MSRKPNTTGYTLIETLVSISILMVSIAAPLYIAWRGTQLIRIAQDQFIASFLAQDAIEHVRYRMETNHANRRAIQDEINAGTYVGQYAPLAYDELFNDCRGSANRCRIDTVADTITACGGPGSCPTLRRDPVTGRYAYDAGFSEQTNFVREVYLTDPGGVDFWEEYEIVVEVRYGSVDRRTFELRHVVYDWRERY